MTTNDTPVTHEHVTKPELVDQYDDPFTIRTIDGEDARLPRAFRRLLASDNDAQLYRVTIHDGRNYKLTIERE